MTDNSLIKRILEISYKHKLTHISSCLTSVGILDDIYSTKKHDEPFVLSNGHAALALYVVLEKYYFLDAEALYLKHGTHPYRDLQDKIFVSTGSLGQGITVAVGMALANQNRNVYVLISDGECAEGSVWESLRIASELRLENLRITVNANGHGAYCNIDTNLLDIRLQMFYPTLVVKTNLNQFPSWVNGIGGHYFTMKEENYKEIMKNL